MHCPQNSANKNNHSCDVITVSPAEISVFGYFRTYPPTKVNFLDSSTIELAICVSNCTARQCTCAEGCHRQSWV